MVYIKRTEIPKLSEVGHNEYHRNYGATYRWGTDEYNKTKRLQTITRLGYLPTTKTCDKYHLTEEDLRKYWNKYLEKGIIDNDTEAKHLRFENIINYVRGQQQQEVS